MYGNTSLQIWDRQQNLVFMNIKDASLDGSYISLQRILRQQGVNDFSTEEAAVLLIKDR